VKNLLLLPLVALTLGACSTKTLLNINLDADSFLAPATRSNTFDIGVTGNFDRRLPDDDGDADIGNDPDGSSLSVPQLSFITGVKLNLGVTLNTSATATLELFIAPDNTADIYQPQFRVLQGTNSTGTTFTANADLSATSSDPAQQQAFTAIKSGKFRLGARVQGSSTPGATVNYTIDNLGVSVAGYPIKLFF
jgi:hypothetical protein